MTEPQNTMRWVWRGCALAVLLVGWLFITWQNHFHITAPLVIICLGYLAVVATVYNLWWTGAAAVGGDDDGDSTWAKPVGAIGELEREKRTLLKAIKEAEFDHQMGKLSKRDVDDMIRTYRVRAIEVIKEIDQLGLGAAGSTREQILREVRARIQIEAKTEAKIEAKIEAMAVAKAQKKSAAEPKPATSTPAPITDASDAVAVAAVVASDASARAAQATQAASDKARDERDEELNADSTTSVAPPREQAAKEATR